jgi:hypothetical protein
METRSIAALRDVVTKACHWTSLWPCLVALLVFALPGAVAAQTVVTNLNSGELNTALQGGGTVTFSVDGTIVLTNTITISTNVVLDGTNHSIILSGGGTNEIFILPAAINFTLRNLTLANGKSNGVIYFGNLYGAPGYGGAIYSQGNLGVEQCIFSNNIAIGGLPEGDSSDSGFGGAIYSTGSLNITNTLFVNNAAIGSSGWGYLADNEEGGNGQGGAICNVGGTVCLWSVTFLSNSAAGGVVAGAPYSDTCGNGEGGAIYSSGGVISASNLVAISNLASGGQSPSYEYVTAIQGGSAAGGALYLTSTTTTIASSYFSNNVTLGGGGGGAEPDGGPFVYGPSGVSEGGSIFNAGSALLSQCVIVASHAIYTRISKST